MVSYRTKLCIISSIHSILVLARDRNRKVPPGRLGFLLRFCFLFLGVFACQKVVAN